MTIVAARNALSSIGWLAETSEKFSAALLAKSTFQQVARGDTVYLSGDPSDGLYGVVSGCFAYEVAPNEIGPHSIHFLRGGFWFGEAEIFDGRENIGTVIATRASSYLHVPRWAIVELAKQDTDTWRWIGQLGGQHLELAIGAIDDSLRRKPGERLVAVLLRLGGVRHRDLPWEPQPEIDIAQSDLALMATLARSSVVSHLDRLEAAGLISRSYACIKLLDPERLRGSLSGGELPPVVDGAVKSSRLGVM